MSSVVSALLQLNVYGNAPPLTVISRAPSELPQVSLRVWTLEIPNVPVLFGTTIVSVSSQDAAS